MKEKSLSPKNKKGLLMKFLFCVVFVGVFLEYQHQIMPLDEAQVIYVPGKAVENPAVSVAQESVDAQIIKTQENTSQNAKVKEEVQLQEKNVPEDENTEALSEFLKTLKTIIKERDEISFQENVLDKIKIAEESVAEKKAEQLPFEEGKIEIYDENKGIIGVIDTKSLSDNNVAEKKSAVKEKILETAKINEVKNSVQSQDDGLALKKKSEDDARKKIENMVVDLVKDVEKIDATNVEKLKGNVSSVVDMMQAMEKDNVNMEEISENMAEVLENAHAKDEEVVKQLIQNEIDQVTADGNEAPVVLIPGM